MAQIADNVMKKGCPHCSSSHLASFVWPAGNDYSHTGLFSIEVWKILQIAELDCHSNVVVTLKGN
jgi:hypothetical protein